MEILAFVIITAIVLTAVYFFPIQKNRYGERLYGRKHLQRDVNATLKAVFPEKHESKEEVIERKKKSRALTDHIIGADLLSEEEAWVLFKVLFRNLAEIELGSFTLNLLSTDIIVHDEERILTFEDAHSPTERIRFFLLHTNIPEFSKGAFWIFSTLIQNLNIQGWYDNDKFHFISGEPTSEDLERIKELENIQNEFEKENDEKLKAVHQECDDIIDGKVVYDKEKIDSLITWLQDYDKQQETSKFSKAKEERTRFLHNWEENRKRLKGLRKKLKTIRH